MKLNPLFAADFYKTGHIYQYPKGTEYVYANFTARSTQHARMPKSFDNKIAFVGFQGFVKHWLIETWNNEFFNQPKDKVVKKYARRMNNALGPGVVTAEHIAALHDLGYLPVSIKALPEGSRVDIKVPPFTVINTHPDFFWVTNYLEDVLSNGNWKPITVATIAYEYRRILNKYVELTGGSKEFADWQLHDFSMRGLSGPYDAPVVGMAHIAAAGFGTDNIPALDYVEEYYNADSDKELLGGGVPATEHSVMCMGGLETEVDTFRRLITEVYSSGIVSIVSDTWDFWNVITNTAAQLKEEILNRTPNALGQAKVVFRPDSGDPVEILCGADIPDYSSKASSINFAVAFAADKAVDIVCSDTPHGECGASNVTQIFRFKGKVYSTDIDIEWDRYDKQYYYMSGYDYEAPVEIVLSPEQKGAVECLWDIFGGDITEKGYKTLNQRVGLIYGDSITLKRAEEILQRLADKGFSASNVVFGIGSYTYQYITRDTFGMAMKATFGVVNGEDRELFKDPKTGDGMKKSAKGLLRVEYEDGQFVLYDQQTREQEQQGCLREVFRDGNLLIDESLATIRERLKQ